MNAPQSTSYPAATCLASGRGGTGTLEKAARALLTAFVATVPLDVIPVGGMASVSSWLGGPLVALALLAVIQRGTLHRLLLVQRLAIAFLFWAAASIAWTIDVASTTQRVTTFAQLVVFFLIFDQFVRGRPDVLRRQLGAFVAGSGLVALSVYASFLTGRRFEYDESRYTGFGYDPNDLGVTIALAIPLAWYLAITGRSKLQRFAVVVFVPVAAAAVALTGSRGAVLATVVALSGIPLAAQTLTRKARLLAVAVVVALGVGAIGVVPEETWARIAAVRQEVTSGNIGQRGAIWRAGWDVFADNWAVGIGAGAFPEAVRPVLHRAWVAHNTPLSVATELGLIGATLFFGGLAFVLVQGARAALAVRTTAFVTLATWLVGASSLTWEYRKTTWLVIAALAALGHTRRPRRPRE